MLTRIVLMALRSFALPSLDRLAPSSVAFVALALLACEGPVGRESAAASSVPPLPPLPSVEEAPLRSVHVRAEGQLGPGSGTLWLDLLPAPGTELSEGAPFRLQARGDHLTFPESIRTQFAAARLPLRVPLIVTDGATGPAELTLSYYTCRSGPDASCRPERTRLIVALDLSGSGEGGEAHVTHRAGS